MDPREENYNWDVQVEVFDSENSDSENDDQVSLIVDNEELIGMNAPSEADEDEIKSPYNFEDFAREGMKKIEETERLFKDVKKRFLAGMGSLKNETTVVSAHKCLNTASVTMQARIDSFRVFCEAMARKRGGESNQRRAWYGSSRDEICQIVSRGFSRCDDPRNDDSYGVGIYLNPNFSLDSAISSVEDESGLRHVLMCRVIRGKVEQITRGSKQIRPNSRNFDSGVDNLVAPTKFIIWGADMNAHILPEYLISFKTPGLANIHSRPRKQPRTPWMSFPILISTLSMHLNPTRMALVVRSYNDFRAKVISRPQFVMRISELAGDELLIRLISANPMDPPRN